MHSPVEPYARHTKSKLRYPMATDTDGSSHQQCRMVLGQIPPSSMTHSHSYQPQGKNCRCQLDLGHPEAPLPHDKPNFGGTGMLFIIFRILCLVYSCCQTFVFYSDIMAPFYGCTLASVMVCVFDSV